MPTQSLLLDLACIFGIGSKPWQLPRCHYSFGTSTGPSLHFSVPEQLLYIHANIYFFFCTIIGRDILVLQVLGVPLLVKQQTEARDLDHPVLVTFYFYRNHSVSVQTLYGFGHMDTLHMDRLLWTCFYFKCWQAVPRACYALHTHLSAFCLEVIKLQWNNNNYSFITMFVVHFGKGTMVSQVFPKTGFT